MKPRWRTIQFYLRLCIILVAVMLNNAVPATAEVYATWDGFEVDKCASIWLIKRFVDTDARFKFFKKNELITEGIPFDVPNARIKRYHNMSAFQSILRSYGINDPKLDSIGRIVHDIEINIWEKKVYARSHEVQITILSIIDKATGPSDVIEASCRYFDKLYEIIPPNQQLKRN